VPVSKLKSNPVAALELLVGLYLDPEIASPRKVSVWYAFWGEASSRQEYYDICGQKDENFAALVRELIGRLIEATGRRDLDADAVALGLIGVLEILWQDFAFRSEADIDRPAAKRRAMAYLKSVFPGRFGEPREAPPARNAKLLPGWVYSHERAIALERAALFQGAWQLAAHESELPRAGDFLAADLGTERVLLLRDSYGAIRALRNNCTVVPHALVTAHSGRLGETIECRVHGLKFDRTGRGLAGAALQALETHLAGGWVMVRSPAGTGRAARALALPSWPAARSALRALPAVPDIELEANWKLVVEQWLTAADAVETNAVETLAWSIRPLAVSSQVTLGYRRLAGSAAGEPWRCWFVAPNQLIEYRPDGVSALSAIPAGPDRCRLRRIHLSLLPAQREAVAAQYLAMRLSRFERRSTLAVVESAQRGVADFGYRPSLESTVRSGTAWFRDWLSSEIPALAEERPPAES
jgi:nitrite reductase/ring-hydroxylating ferredoxin subunit